MDIECCGKSLPSSKVHGEGKKGVKTLRRRGKKNTIWGKKRTKKNKVGKKKKQRREKNGQLSQDPKISRDPELGILKHSLPKSVI